jgi:hypothetical protein
VRIVLLVTRKTVERGRNRMIPLPDDGVSVTGAALSYKMSPDQIEMRVPPVIKGWLLSRPTGRRMTGHTSIPVRSRVLNRVTGCTAIFQSLEQSGRKRGPSVPRFVALDALHRGVLIL